MSFNVLSTATLTGVVEVIRLLQQLHDLLRQLVGLRHHRHAGLLQNLGA